MAVTFRAKSQEVKEAFEKGKEAYENLTNKQRYGDNGTLNFLVLHGWERVKELQAEKEEAGRKLVKATEF